MIEVTAFLSRGSVYLAGETVQCIISFVNVLSSSDGNHRCIDTLAWASAQIHCQCTIREHGGISSKAQVADGESSGMTYFQPTRGEEGYTVIATEPKIIFCDLRLAPGESRTFVYQQQLPTDAVPSFRGRYVKYAYKVTIGTQRPDAQIKLMRIPFRVLLVPDMGNHNVYGHRKYDLKPSNPFLTTCGSDNAVADSAAAGTDVLDGALQALAMLTARRSPNHYNISTSKGKVAKFSIFKHNYKIGDDVIGLMDFSDAMVPCLKFSVSLQSEETVLPDRQDQAPANGVRPAVAAAAAAAAGGGSAAGRLQQPPQPVSGGCLLLCHGTHEEHVLHTRRTSFSLPVPVAATPGFSTDIVQLKWSLRFRFVTVSSPAWHRTRIVDSPSQQPVSAGGESLSASSTAELWSGRLELDTETTEWTLPLKVFATSPLLCGGSSGSAPSSSSAAATSGSVGDTVQPATRSSSSRPAVTGSESSLLV